MMPDDPSIASSSGRQIVPRSPERPSPPLDAEGDLLGVRELNSAAHPVELRPSDGSEDDDTAQSSTDPQGDGSIQQRERSSSFGRFIQNTRRRFTSNALDPADETPIYTVEGKIEAEDDDLYQGQVKPLIYGYLHKLSRSGKWQLRFFETDGESLSYFKSEKRVKLLATLDLFKVGTITMSAEDPTGCTFSIQVADRPYSLRAESKSTCKDWVIALNRIKEARMQVGGVKLVTPKFHVQPPDLLDENGGRTHDIAPRVVLVANRQRTRAVATENPQAWEQLVQNQVQYNPPKVWVGPNHTSQRSQRLALGRWNKRQNTFHNLKLRLLQWARSLRKKATCTTAEGDVVTSDSSSKRDDIASEKKEAEMSMSRRMDRDDSSTWSEAEETKVEISPQIFDDEGEARQLA